MKIAPVLALLCFALPGSAGNVRTKAPGVPAVQLPGSVPLSGAPLRAQGALGIDPLTPLSALPALAPSRPELAPGAAAAPTAGALAPTAYEAANPLALGSFAAGDTRAEDRSLWTRLRTTLSPVSPEDLEQVKFDGGAAVVAAEHDPADPLGLDGLKRKGERWFKDGKPLERLGKGTVGYVDVHPSRPGLIVKTISPSVDQFFAGLTVNVAIEADDKAAQVLAEAGIGPRVLGTTRIAGRHLSVRERIFGKTITALADERGFGPEEEALVLEMVRRMAAANAIVTDLKPENIMIGATERDPERRAYFVDGGMVEPLPAGLTEEQRVDKILDYPNVVGMWMAQGKIHEIYRPLRLYLAQARDRSSSSPWRRFLKGAANAMLQANIAGANK